MVIRSTTWLRLIAPACAVAGMTVALTFAPRAEAFVYWTNFGSEVPTPVVDGTIGRTNLDGTGVDQSFITGALDPCGVAVDALTSTGPPGTSPPPTRSGAPTWTGPARTRAS